jgi:hypothetical protein
MILLQSRKIKVDFDKERERINSCEYEPHQKKNLLKLVDLCEQLKFREACEFAREWGDDRDPELECREAEFISIAIVELLHYHNDGWKFEVVDGTG